MELPTGRYTLISSSILPRKPFLLTFILIAQYDLLFSKSVADPRNHPNPFIFLFSIPFLKVSNYQSSVLNLNLHFPEWTRIISASFLPSFLPFTFPILKTSYFSKQSPKEKKKLSANLPTTHPTNLMNYFSSKPDTPPLHAYAYTHQPLIFTAHGTPCATIPINTGYCRAH